MNPKATNLSSSFPHRSIPGSSDIGLIKLETPLRMTKRVAKIALPEKNSEPSGDAILSGWGAIDNNNDNPGYPNILQTMDVPIVERTACDKAVKAVAAETGEAVDLDVDKTNVCTGPLTGGQSACSVSIFSFVDDESYLVKC